MNQLAKKGRNQAISLVFSVLLISMFTIAFYSIRTDSVDAKKLVQQIIRFGLTLLLIYFLFQGKNWARITMIVLFLLGAIAALAALLLPVPMLAKTPFLVMALIYSLGAYLLYFSRAFKAYFDYLNS